MSDLGMPELRRALVEAARLQHETPVDRAGEPGEAHAPARWRWHGLARARWRWHGLARARWRWHGLARARWRWHGLARARWRWHGLARARWRWHGLARARWRWHGLARARWRWHGLARARWRWHGLARARWRWHGLARARWRWHGLARARWRWHGLARARWRWSGLRTSRWRAVPVMLLLLLFAGAAVALASGLISFGAPATSVPVFANPRTGLGRIAPGTVRLLPISAPDPHGGLPWGMRVLSTTRGVGCLQVGRLLDGELVALGQDGAFGNDGRAHELPLSTNVERLNCSFVDGHGRIFDSVTIKSEAASAAAGVHCEPPGTYAPSHHAAFSTCPLADERNLYYGMLGPDATGLTYLAGGKSHTVATVGPGGAYLIVTPGTTHRYSGAAGSHERAGLYVSDEVPVYGPITAIHYRGGATCHLVTAERWIYGSRACAPPLPEPFGWVQVGVPTHAQLATPIHATLIRDAEGRPAIRVRFTSRVAISSLRGQYQLEWHEPGMAPETYAAGPIDEGASASYSGLIPQGRNIAAGQTLTKTLDQNRFGPRLALGITTGRVILDYATGSLIQAEEDTAKIPVGTFKIRVPSP